MTELKPIEIFTRNEYRDDCERIQTALEDKGYSSSLEQCAELWEIYSDSYCAGWMSLDVMSDDQIFDAISPYFNQ